MEKKFTMENDVGILVNYTILAVLNDYVIYTNYMPSDNELGIRLLAGKLASKDPIKVKRIPLAEQKEVIDEFKMAIITSGRTIKRAK